MGTARVSKGKIRVLVADRGGIFRLGLKKLFAVEDDLRVVAGAEKADEVLARAETFRPHLVFIQEEILGERGGNLISAVVRQNSISFKGIDYSAGSLHTPTHDRDTAMAGNFD